VIIFSRRAVNESDWVNMEAQVLRWRDWREENFKLIPVLCDGVELDELKNSRWEPLQFKEVTALSNPVKETIKSALAELQNLIGREHEPTRLDELIDAIASRLHGIGVSGLHRAYKAISGQRCAHSEEKAACIELARLLITEGLNCITELRNHTSYYLKNDHALEIIEILAPLWVRPHAAGQVNRIALSNELDPVFSIEGNNLIFTGEMLIRQASGLHHDKSWAVVNASAPTDAKAELIDQIRDALVERCLGNSPYFDPENQEQQLTAVLQRRRDKHEPTFVLLSHTWLNIDDLQEVFNRFPGVTFFFVLKENQRSLKPEAIPLISEIPDRESETGWYEIEDEALTEYHFARSCFN
jgi:hypothetical protein